jgi:hypothetical protein
MPRACPLSPVPPLLEPLEPRVLLDGTPEEQALQLFSVSPALFVENQGQWADPPSVMASTTPAARSPSVTAACDDREPRARCESPDEGEESCLEFSVF